MGSLNGVVASGFVRKIGPGDGPGGHFSDVVGGKG